MGHVHGHDYKSQFCLSLLALSQHDLMASPTRRCSSESRKLCRQVFAAHNKQSEAARLCVCLAVCADDCVPPSSTHSHPLDPRLWLELPVSGSTIFSLCEAPAQTQQDEHIKLGSQYTQHMLCVQMCMCTMTRYTAAQ